MDRMWVALTVASAAACARFPAAPAEGGPAWTELTSEHFTVWTDADCSRVWEVTREMERFRNLVAGIAYPTMPSSGRALAVVVHNDLELSEISNSGEERAFAVDAAAPLWQTRWTSVSARHTLPAGPAPRSPGSRSRAAVWSASETVAPRHRPLLRRASRELASALYVRGLLPPRLYCYGARRCGWVIA